MIVTFKELGIIPAQYNGMQYGMVRALIINVACDYVMVQHFPNQREELCLFNVRDAGVSFANETVNLDTVEPCYH